MKLLSGQTEAYEICINMTITCRIYTQTAMKTFVSLHYRCWCYESILVFFKVDVYDETKVVIGCVTPQRPGFFARIHPHFSKIADDTHSRKKKKTNKYGCVTQHTHPVLPLCIHIQTHSHIQYMHTNTHSQPLRDTIFV